MAQEAKMEKRKKDYLKNPSSCPVCKSNNITAGPLDADGTTASSHCECLSCGERWVDIYKLVDIEPEGI